MSVHRTDKRAKRAHSNWFDPKQWQNNKLSGYVLENVHCAFEMRFSVDSSIGIVVVPSIVVVLLFHVPVA